MAPNTLMKVIKSFKDNIDAEESEIDGIRALITDSFKKNHINEKQRDELILELYVAADLKGLFYFNILNKEPEKTGENQTQTSTNRKTRRQTEAVVTDNVFNMSSILRQQAIVRDAPTSSSTTRSHNLDNLDDEDDDWDHDYDDDDC